MSLRRPVPVVALLLLSIARPAAAAEAPWPHLDRTTIGAAAFTDAHPQWDGRGVAIAVVDSGVDIGLPGLQTTSTGAVKVVEARDFTGAGDVALVEPDWRDGVPHHPDGWAVAGLDQLGVTPGSEDVLLGMIREADYRGSAAEDLDGDGAHDGRWAVVCLGEPDGWTLRVDLDGDGDVAGEPALKDYGRAHQTFSFGGDPLEPGRTRLALAPTILWRERTLSLHFDDGGHGTHVAGIAAGHAIGGVEGQDGVAPGAQVLSLKIGHNELPGGATVSGSMRDAFAFGARWSEEHGVPLVFNLSYGISAGREGTAGMEAFLDELLVEHPQLVVATSAGNEGPGLSTIGIPAGARHVIAVGSYFTRALATNLRGRDIGADRVVYYSSRGGEHDKPDVVAPGLAFSTVARWDDRPVKSGTSMASPEVAGAIALLLSAARATALAPSWEDVRRALMSTADPVSGYGPLDQGAGLIQVPAAWRALEALAGGGDDRPLTYDVALDGPAPPGYAGRVSYWRAGGWVPDRRQGIRWEITPVFAAGVPADARVSTTANVALRSDAAWLRVDRARVAFQGEQTRTVAARIDGSRLTRPGVYVGEIVGAPAGQSAAVFRLRAVVVVPHRADGPGERRLDWGELRLSPGEVERLFVEVPAGASAMEVRVEVDERGEGKLWTTLYDPSGEPSGRREGSADAQRGGELVYRVDRDELDPGSWELDLIGAHDASVETRAAVTVRFFGLQAAPATIAEVTGGAAEPATAAVTITNRFDDPFEGRAGGRIDRLLRRSEKQADPEGWTHGFELSEARPQATFRLELAPGAYDQMTDVALRVLDPSGAPIGESYVGPQGGEIGVSGQGSYTLEMKAARWDPDAGSIPFTLEEAYHLVDPVEVTVVTADGDEALALYPSLAAELELRLRGTLPRTADGFVAAGEVRFVARRDGSEWLTLPLRVE